MQSVNILQSFLFKSSIVWKSEMTGFGLNSLSILVINCNNFIEINLIQLSEKIYTLF